MKKKETLKVGFLFNWKYRRIEHLLPKEDFKNLLEVVGVTFPTKIVNNRCQGADISLKVDENDNDISFKLKLFTEEVFFHYYKKVLQTNGHVIQEETTFGKKQKGEDKKMNLKTERYWMELNIQLQNEKETTKIYIKAPQYLPTMKANEVFLELENYKFEKTIPEIAKDIEKIILKKVDLKQNEIEVKITKNGIDGSIEKAMYLGKVLQNVWKKEIEENAKIYSITRNKKGILERIQIINKRKFKGLLYHISIQKNIIDMEIRNDKENDNVLKILKRMSREKFENFQEENNGTIHVKIYRRNMTPKLQEFLEEEENLAIKVFHSEKISQ